MTRYSVFLSICLSLAPIVSGPATAQDLPPAPGRMIDLGGYSLHLNCMGEGTPTIVLEAAFGASSLDWEKVLLPASQHARVCSYDRAGFGWSEAGPARARDSKSIAAELRQLLRQARIEGPYILAGHSLGGFHVRMFAHQYPSDVIGMILLDASHEDQFGWKTATHWNVPVPKDLPAPKKFPEMKRTDEARTLIAEMSELPKWRQAAELENQAIGPSVAQLRSAGALPNIPLIVMSAGAERPLEGFWTDRELKTRQLQAKLVALSPRAIQIRVPNSEHYIQLDAPDLVVAAIERLVEVSRDMVNTPVASTH